VVVISETDDFPGRVTAKVYDESKEHKPYEDKQFEAGKPKLRFSKCSYAPDIS